MKKISSSSIKDPERARKRRETRLAKKRQKHNSRKRIAKPIYDPVVLRAAYNTVKAPFYDPYDNHVHIWRYGTIPAIEKSTSRYFSLKRESFTGRYCIVCHEVKHKFNPNFGPDKINNHEAMLVDSVQEYIKNNNTTDDIIESLKKMKLNKEQRQRVKLVEIESTDEELFIPGTVCKFYMNSELLGGTIVDIVDRYITGKKLLRISGSQGNVYTVKSDVVVPVYNDDIQRKESMSPLRHPPTHVSKKVVYVYKGKEYTSHKIWEEKWISYVKWLSFVRFLRDYLPFQVKIFYTKKEYPSLCLEPPNQGTPGTKKLSDNSLVERRIELIKNFSTIKHEYKFLMKRPRPPTTYYKAVDTVGLDRELKRLKIS